MNLSFSKRWMYFFVLFILQTGLNAYELPKVNTSGEITFTSCDFENNETEIVFSNESESDWNPLAPPFECGTSVVTYNEFGGMGNSVMSVIDNREHASAPMFASASWTSVHPLYSHPDWTATNMGRVFGTAIDNQYNIYVTTSVCFGKHFPGGLAGAGPGTIYKADAATGAISVFANLPTNVLTSGVLTAGLGNICFNPDNNLLYVSNIIDGKIYCLDMVGNIVDTFDPPLSGTAIVGDGFYDPAATPEAAALGQRIWGIGYTNGTLYFGVWREDQGHISIDNNELWSVDLLGTGLFNGATNVNGDHYDFAILERSMPQLDNSPISDIAFSSDGDELIIGTRTMTGPSTYGAHRSAVWRLPRANLGTAALMQYYVGNLGSKTNCAGGVDVGYASVKQGETPDECDDMIWTTGDALTWTVGNYVYGVSGIPFSGNTVSNVSNTSVYIDVDNDIIYSDKTKYGDIEIFKCGCRDTSIVDVPDVCDSISIRAAKEQGDGCCFELYINNTAEEGTFSYVELQTTGGTSISSFMSLNGWLPQSYSATNLVMAHPSGVFPPGVSAFTKVCLSEYYSGPQSIIVNYYNDLGLVICSDSITVECTQDPKCISVVQDSITCSQKVGEYLYEFCISSNDMIGWEVNSIVLNPPAGVTMTPNSFSIPALGPGMTSCTYVTSITGALPGEEVCFSVTGHSENVVQQEQALNCCTDTVDLVCVIIPDCSPCKAIDSRITSVQSDDGCCWDIILNNGFDDNYFTAVSAELITPGVIYSSILNYPGSGWFMDDITAPFSSTHPQFKPYPPFGGFIGSNDTLPTICFGGIDDASEIPQTVVLHWWAGDRIVCSDTLYADCPIEDVEDNCAKIINEKIECGQKSGTYIVTFDIVNNTGHDIHEIDLSGIAPGYVLSPTNFMTTILAGDTLVGVTTNINGVGVGPFCFHITLHEIDSAGNNLACCTTNDEICFDLPNCDSCGCGGFTDVLLNINAAASLKIECGHSLQMDCPQTPPQVFSITGLFNCEGDCEMEGLAWEISHEGAVVQTGTMTLTGSNFSFDVNSDWFSSGGTYVFSLTGRCGDEECICMFSFVFPDDCGPSDCCEDEEAFYDSVNASFKSLKLTYPCDTLCFEAVADSCVEYCINWGDGSTVDCLTEGEICHTFDSPVDAWFNVCVTATEGTASASCFKTTVCDSFFVKACDDQQICECGAFDKVELIVSPNDPDQNISFECNGQPIDVGCPPTEEVIYPIQGTFNCDGNCEMSDLNWSISYEGTMIQSGTMTTIGTDFSFDINTLWFQNPGQYNFTLTGKCGDQVCRCRFSLIIPEGCNDEDCCTDQEAFYDAANHAFNSINYVGCDTLCFEVPQDSCIEYCISWGDGSDEDCITDGKICHPYNLQVATTFDICLTATSSVGDSICFETKICKKFDVKPCGEECGCGGFTDLSMNFPDQHVEKLECGKEFDLGCPEKNTKYKFRGWYNCEGDCAPDDLNWSLSHNGTVTHDGELLTGITGPGGIQIGVILPSDWFTNPGVYELTYSGSCGGEKCDCTIKFIVKENCGCSCDTLQEDVAQGFLETVSVDLSCKILFTPVALTSCDEVFWTIEDESGEIYTETTTGNAPIDYEFTDGKDYLITMTVVRVDANGKECKSEYQYKFTMKCNAQHAVCDDDIIKNPGFTDGLNDWEIISGKPYVNKAMGSQDVGFLVLKGNAIAGDEVRQVVENELKDGEDYVISFDIKTIGASKGDKLYVSVCGTGEPQDNDCDGDIVAVIDLEENTDSYVTKSFRKRPGRTKYSNITLKRGTDDDNGNTGEVLIDNVCLSIVDSLHVANEDIQFTESINFYPNPINSTLNIEMENPNRQDISITVRDIWGRVVTTSILKRQTTNMTMDFSSYVNGVYMVELTKSNGARLHKKIIKQ